jgi:hypothetical protein
MEILCPQCQQKLTISDQYAGQMMRCPLCNGTFTAPSLAPPLAAPPATYGMAVEPAAAPLPVPPGPETISYQESPAVVVQEPTAPPPSPGEYSKSLRLKISSRILPFLAPISLVLVLLISFFPWAYKFPVSLEEIDSAFSNAWSLGFGRNGQVLIGMYLVFYIVTFLLAIPSTLISLGVLPMPPVIKGLGPWRVVVVGGPAVLAFFFLLIQYLTAVFRADAMTLWYKLAFRIHFLVVIANLLEFWYLLRAKRNLPEPVLEVRW